MSQTYIYVGAAFVTGFVAALLVCLYQWIKIRKNQKSLEGFLESEKLVKERFQKENGWLHDVKENAQKEYEFKMIELESKVEKLQAVIKMMDEDILLLQKSNEDTEDLLKAGEPVVNALRLKLIEANNTISRYKAQVMVK
ncbi:MAG: hypothetical protein ABI402_18815 [Ferruginibacter sp.]